MIGQGLLLVATIAFPLVLLAACVDARVRKSGRLLLLIAPLPGLMSAIALPVGTSVQLPDVLLGLSFILDRPGALLLGAAALLWIAAGVYVGFYRRANSSDDRFTVWWLATLSGSLGVFIAADLIGFYLFFTIVSLAAYWLVVDDGTPPTKRAGAIYVSFALLGEAFLLMAFVLLAAAAGGKSLQIVDVVAGISASPLGDWTLALLILGFGVKIGMVPLHVWMPLTYTSAPIPVAAVLSGAAVKAGLIGLIRFLPLDMAMPGWGEVLAILGMVSAFYGVAIGITQSNPRTILAYSSISQMGVIATVLGMGLAVGDKSVMLLVAFYALHHVLVKGGLFLALGAIEQGKTGGLSRGLWSVLVPAGIIALGLGGLPLTGGALVKLAVKPPLDEGVFGYLGILSAAASTLLMLHFLRRMASEAAVRSEEIGQRGLVAIWLIIAAAALALPWILYTSVTAQPVSDAWSAKALWDAIWSVLLGVALAMALWRWGNRMPRVPAGDVLALGEPMVRGVSGLGQVMERVDRTLRQWPVAGAMLLLIVAVLVSAGFAVR